MDNASYVRIDNIYQRLTQRLTGREIKFEDIVEWCAECELTEIGQFMDWNRYIDVELTLTDYQVELPANCWYVKVVKSVNNTRFIEFYINGNYINVPTTVKDTKIWVNYYAYPVDSETGYLLIPRGHENACFWYCMKALLLNEYMDGRIDQNRWNTIQNEFQMACEKATAQSGRISDNDRVKVIDALHTKQYNYKDPTAR